MGRIDGVPRGEESSIRWLSRRIRTARRTVALAISAWALAWTAGPALALDPTQTVARYHRDAWGAEDGLPQVTVDSLAQTDDGYLWIGTQDGLARFDGVRFEVFDRSNTEALITASISALEQGRDGALWIGSQEGGLVRYREGEFELFDEDDGLPSRWILGMLATDDGALWTGYEYGLTRFDGSEFVPISLPGDRIAVTKLAQTTDGTVWVGTRLHGLFRVVGDEVEPAVGNESTVGHPITALHAGSDGSLWVGTEDAGLFHRTEGTTTRFTTADGLTTDSIASLSEDRDGSLWIGTYSGGLCRLRDGHLDCQTLEQGLGADSVGALCEDHEGSLWLGTKARGLQRLRDTTFSAYTTRDGLSCDSARAILEGEDGIWIGTDAGLNLLVDGTFREFPQQQAFASHPVMALHESTDGSLWMGAFQIGLSRLVDGGWRPPDAELEHVTAIVDDRDGGLLIGSRVGLSRYTDGRVEPIPLGLTHGHVKALHRARDGSLWMGTHGSGPVRYADGEVQALLPETNGGLSVVLAVYEDADGTLWFGTAAGLIRHREGVTRVFTAADGLPDDRIYAVLEDDTGHLWLSGNRGVSRVGKASLEAVERGDADAVEVVTYTSTDGMPATECNGGIDPAAMRSEDGRLWFPTMGGVAVVDPSRLYTSDVPPPVVLERVLVEGRPVDPGGPLRLAAGIHHLEIQFTALSFIAPDRMRFRYRLEGFEDDWIDPGARRAAHYTNLPPGSYRFVVSACNADGVWNHEGVELKLTQRPHLHQMPVFWAAIALAALVGMWGLYRVRLRQMRRRQRELEDLVEKRSRQLVETENLLAEARHLPIRFGPYILVSILGEGGMARVYRAVREGPMGFRKELAVKRIRTDLTRDDQELIRSLVREARLGGQLRHPNVVDTYEFGSVQDQYYLAMEFVDGLTLSALLDGAAQRNARLPAAVVLDLMVQVCEGLAYAHDATSPEGEPLHLVHRDLKPSNLIVSTAGQVKVMDFGIALSDADRTRLTVEGSFKGTPRFMSPEQLQTPDDLDRRSDLFALGGVLFEALTGCPLLAGATVEAQVWMIVSGAFRSRLGMVEAVLPAAVPILQRCLQLDREDRYPDAAALATDLRELRRNDPTGCSELMDLLAALTRDDDKTLSRLRDDVAARAPEGSDWPAFLEALDVLEDQAADPFRRCGHPNLGVVSLAGTDDVTARWTGGATTTVTRVPGEE
jgi:ligand-binding sensor domain-containing protein/serine/threonine protein kinase